MQEKDIRFKLSSLREELASINAKKASIINSIENLQRSCPHSDTETGMCFTRCKVCQAEW